MGPEQAYKNLKETNEYIKGLLIREDIRKGIQSATSYKQIQTKILELMDEYDITFQEGHSHIMHVLSEWSQLGESWTIRKKLDEAERDQYKKMMENMQHPEQSQSPNTTGA